MLILSLVLGIAGFGIYLLGIIGLFSSTPVGLWLLFIALVYVLLQHKKSFFFHQFSLYEKALLGLLLISCFVNLIGDLGPELAFDALWYHLTLAKIYVGTHIINFIPGNLLYYSAMPRLGEMYYSSALLFGDEITAKTIHYIFGILTLLATYILATKFVTRPYALLAILIMSTNLVFAWESTTGYIDLIRSFFEITALMGFITWTEKKEQKYLLITGALIGFAIGTKLLAIGSIIIFVLLTIWYTLQKKSNIKAVLLNLLTIIALPIILVLPWLAFSYVHTGSFFYPFFPKIFEVEAGSSLNPIVFLKDTWMLLTHADDPLSPIYVMTLPMVILYISKQFKIRKNSDAKLILVFLYCLFTFTYWYVAPHIGQARYILPYLPAWSVLAAIVIAKLNNNLLQKLLIGIIIFISILNTGYRAVANSRYIPFIIGQETKSDFLAKHLNFSYGDFYDTDGYFAAHIKPTDNVLLFGFHNLYYVDFPYIHSSWRKPTDRFNYVATQDTSLPQEFTGWHMIYENTLTRVKLYTK